MKTLLIAASMIAAATPAMAQMTGTSPNTSATPPASEPAMPAAQGTPGQSSSAATSSAAPAADAKAVIASEFPTYDKDGNGALSTSEFDAWMVALKEKSGAEPMQPAEKSAWLKGAFKSADADKNKAVSQTELTTYLTAGA